MKVFKLFRFFEAPDTWFGVLRSEERPVCLTLELPWHNNEPNISCIPDGEYTCKRILSPRFGDTFEIMEVLGRKDILFHKGNSHIDTHGCIILGSSFGMVGGTLGLIGSGIAFEEFKKELEGQNEFKLVIYEA